MLAVASIFIAMIATVVWRALYPSSHRAVTLRLYGSDLLGSDLMRDLTKGFLKQEGADEKNISVDESKAHLGELRVSGFIPKDLTQITVEVLLKDSATAFNSMRNNECDIGVLWRKMSNDENAEMRKNGLGDMLTGKNECVLAQDNIAIIVNGDNPLTSLSRDELKDIFTADINRWEQLQRKTGGRMSGPIKIYVPLETSEIYTAFCEALGIKGIKHPEPLEHPEDYASVSDGVSLDHNAIGFVNVPYIRSAKRVEILDGEGAQLAAGRDGGRTYLAFAKPVYLYKSGKANEYAERFKSFILSTEGRKIVRDAKFDPRTPEEMSPPAPEPPPLYKKLTEHAVQLKGFRCLFEQGSSKLSKECAVAINGLVTSLKEPKNNGWKGVMIFGFADSTGEEDPNLSLSKKRAQAIAARMSGQIEPEEVEGFGSSLPVASNEDSAGRGMNRRVEVWLRP
jgi:phosphate transport system substrate-binding protein